MSSESWTAQITVTVHGVWDPKNAQACTELLAVINRLRSPDNPRPCIRRVWWRDDEDNESPWLDVHIENTSMRLDPGEHLVSVVLPNGETEWNGWDNYWLATMRPPAEAGDAA